MGWADTEFETIDLGDERRNKRAIRLVERLSAQPMASVPQACGDWADTMAAYRFFDNEEIDWRAILGAHTDCARTRMAGHEVVLCIQDTTELDFNGQGAFGLGPLSYEAQRGMYLHPTYAVTPDREARHGCGEALLRQGLGANGELTGRFLLSPSLPIPPGPEVGHPSAAVVANPVHRASPGGSLRDRSPAPRHKIG